MNQRSRTWIVPVLSLCVGLLTARDALSQTPTGANVAEWTPRTPAQARAEVVSALRDRFLRDQLALGRTLLEARRLLAVEVSVDGETSDVAEPDAEAEADAAPDAPDARVARRLAELEAFVGQEEALLDLVAVDEALPLALQPLAFEALALVGPEREAHLLLRVVDALGAGAPPQLLERLGAVGTKVPAVEPRLVELTRRQLPRCATELHHALSLCGGKLTVERLGLVRAFARGELDAALDAWNTLDGIARREGRLVAEAIVAQLDDRSPQGGCEESRRPWIYKVLTTAGDDAAAPHLLAWVGAQLERPAADAASPALPDAFKALGAIGTEASLEPLLGALGADRPKPLQLAAVSALALVPRDAAFELGVPSTLVGKLDEAERTGDRSLKPALVQALRQFTAPSVGASASAFANYLRREEIRRKQAAERTEETGESVDEE